MGVSNPKCLSHGGSPIPVTVTHLLFSYFFFFIFFFLLYLVFMATFIAFVCARVESLLVSLGQTLAPV